ncbi:unnamed protein product [Linum tenue]|uniref:Protein ENDOSPERM DEFECTIVE 1 n=1 Tax=Linum tenue TaxID=586396 RepID=A0AAV0JTH3_9ROSI|nr:unnamed protein product [Linum tenue]
MGEDHSSAVEAPPPQRRPRVREVNSRFMTPAPTSSTSFSPLPQQQHQRSTSVHQQRRRLELDKDSSAGNSASPTVAAAAVKLFKENANGERQDPRSHHHRPDTPMATAPPPTSRRLPHHRPCNAVTHSAAAKLLQSSTGMSSSLSVNLSANPNSGPTESLPDLRSSRATVSRRILTERNINTLSGPDDDDDAAASTTTSSSWKFPASPCSLSLDLQRSSSENPSFFHSLRGSEKSAKIGGFALPPVPHAKDLSDANASRKGRKASGQQEGFHAMRMIHNRYLQWRYANAKAEASSQAQSREAEMKLYSLGCKISGLYKSVTKKRIELARLQRMAALSTVLETQMPYLDEWTTIEADCKVSLSETAQALVNASIQLPVVGNVKVDARELAEVLKSSGKLMESIASHIERFLPEAAETETLVSELARVSGGEIAHVQECGDLLSLMHKSQMEECSVRGQIIQVRQKLTTA